MTSVMKKAILESLSDSALQYIKRKRSNGCNLHIGSFNIYVDKIYRRNGIK